MRGVGGRSAPPRPPGQIGLTAPDIVSCRWNKLTESLRLNAKFVLLRLCMRNCFLLLLKIPSVSTLAIWRACWHPCSRCCTPCGQWARRSFLKEKKLQLWFKRGSLYDNKRTYIVGTAIYSNSTNIQVVLEQTLCWSVSGQKLPSVNIWSVPVILLPKVEMSWVKHVYLCYIWLRSC